MTKLIAISLGVYLLLIFNILCLAAAEDARDEIQVLIDVSGSMKQNDPQNMRVEASKLLISLLPEHRKASIWLFAEKTTLLIRTDAVDAEWQKKAIKATANIHANGLYTDIENAVKTTLDSGFKGTGANHLILLTDGFVDISKDIMVSADSRERLLSEWTPKLQQKHIKVETIALSANADKELLNTMALDTDGWMEEAQSAEQLQKAFLKMILKAAPKDNLPLKDNQFSVDSGVKEFSLLVFRKHDSAPSRLITPKGDKIVKNGAPENFAWLESATYDLITVKQPAVGVWRLEADVDPDNQVMIITDLKMQIEDFPNFAAESEALAVNVYFTDQNTLISRADFLGMLTVAAELDGQPPLILKPKAGKAGYFSLDFNGLSQGKHVLGIIADGKTFKREIAREFAVVAEPIKLEKTVNADKREVSLVLQPDLTQMDPSSLVVRAIINRSGKAPETREIAAKDGAWTMALDNLPPGEEVTVNFNAMAKTLDGKAVTPAIKPVKIDDSLWKQAAGADTHEAPAAPEEHAAHSGTETAAAPVEQTEPAADQAARPPSDWLEVGAIVAGVNLLLIGCGFFIFRVMKRARLEKQQKLLERLS